MTLKCSEGHGKWYEWVKLSEYYRHAEFDFHHVCSVWRNQNIQVFATSGHLASQ